MNKADRKKLAKLMLCFRDATHEYEHAHGTLLRLNRYLGEALRTRSQTLMVMSDDPEADLLDSLEGQGLIEHTCRLIGAWDEGGRVLSDLVEEIQGLLNVLVGKEGKTRI